MLVCILEMTYYADRRQSVDNHPCDGLERIGPSFGLCGHVKRQEGRLRGRIFGGSSASVFLEVVHLHCLLIVSALRLVDYLGR